ncbi:MAG: glycine cleavage system aminomethyltransferase GcvT [Leptolyngbyaceae bacterium]|nr:glycine cleavage system aminomethyltransferase GcvT [Leptolyngbyaceae bacterium]
MADGKNASGTALLTTPLYELHREQKARMTPFSGWQMPVQYSGIKPEHHAVRTSAGMFDISHMGKFTLIGPGAIAQLQSLVPSDLNRLTPGMAQYTVLLNESGGIIDDLIIYYEYTDDGGVDHVKLIVNAATTDKDREWLLAHLDTSSLQFRDLSPDYALIAVQGPDAVQHLQACVKEDLGAVARFGHITGTVLGKPGFLARTGYTGEDGFEVMMEPDTGIQLWRSLLNAGVTPCGLGARDTLRLEAAMALYGQDIDDTTSPVEAGLNWLIHLDDKDEFIGRAVIEAQKQNGAPRKLVGLKMEGRAIARHEYPVLFEGKHVGIITSGTLSPTLEHPIALAYVPPELGKIGQALEVEIRGKAYPASVVKKPFYRLK